MSAVEHQPMLKLIPPVKAGISSGFGPRHGPITGVLNEMHSGIDFACALGTPIISASDGIAYHVGFDKFPARGVRSFGLFCVVHTIVDADHYMIYYCHLDRCWIREGLQIEMGMPIGDSGGWYGDSPTDEQLSKRGSATGAHLHFGVKQYDATLANGKWVDPLPMIG